jgi:hypothetical protein
LDVHIYEAEEVRVRLVHKDTRQMYPKARNHFAVVCVLLFDRLNFPTRSMSRNNIALRECERPLPVEIHLVRRRIIVFVNNVLHVSPVDLSLNDCTL